MSVSPTFQTVLRGSEIGYEHKQLKRLLRLIRADQSIEIGQMASRLNTEMPVISRLIEPLIKCGVIERKRTGKKSNDSDPETIYFTDTNELFIGVHLGVRSSQIGYTTLKEIVSDADTFETPADAPKALKVIRERIEKIIAGNPERKLAVIGVSVPGTIDTNRQKIVHSPNLNWRNVDIAGELAINNSTTVIVENDSNAAAIYEAQAQTKTNDGSSDDFVIVRSGTGIGGAIVAGGELFRGSGPARGIAGEFGHMTIVAGGKSCVCGNRGCWEKYASAASAASLYLGDRPPARGESVPRFVQIVSKAENGDVRSRRTLEKIGDYLGVGIANVILGVGIPNVVVSGRLVHGWKFIDAPLRESIERSVVGKMKGWTVRPGSPEGAAVGGALETAVEEYLETLCNSVSP